MNSVFSWLVSGLWMVFLAFWFVGAFSAKKNAASGTKRAFVRVMLMLTAFFFIRSRQPAAGHTETLTSSSPAVRALGVILCAMGIGFAIWARFALGKNWGMPMAVKQNPGLVTTGPYAFVRHPIYTGILLAIVGSAMANEVWWFVLAAIMAVYFVYSATQEEKLKDHEFPNEYAAYKRNTKMLIPFVF